MTMRVVAIVVALATAGCAHQGRTVSAAPSVVFVEAVRGGEAPVLLSGEAPSPPPYWAPNEEVEVEWHGSWWPAVVLEQRGNARWLVHYQGYGDEWDELVGPDRIRERSEPEPDGLEEEEEEADP